jgi:hypothetical protein
MSAQDEIEVRVAGNLCRPVTLTLRDGVWVAASRVAASPIALVGGQLSAHTFQL